MFAYTQKKKKKNVEWVLPFECIIISPHIISCRQVFNKFFYQKHEYFEFLIMQQAFAGRLALTVNPSLHHSAANNDVVYTVSCHYDTLALCTY